MLIVLLVLWVRPGCPLGECAQCVPCPVGVTRELPGECAQCIPCPVGATREPTGWVCSVCPLYCGCDQGAHWVSVLSVSLVLWVWPGSYRVSVLSVSLFLSVLPGSLPGEYAQCVPCTVGATRVPTGWVCSVCPLYCGCDQGAYRVSVLSVSLVLWVRPGSLLGECTQQGSHSTWKTWKNESTPGKPGNIMEFWKINKYQGKVTWNLEKLGGYQKFTLHSFETVQNSLNYWNRKEGLLGY